MDRVWDTFKYPPKPLVTLCQIKVIQGHKVKKVKFNILSLGILIHVLMSHFHQGHTKNVSRTLFERSKSDRI